MTGIQQISIKTSPFGMPEGREVGGNHGFESRPYLVAIQSRKALQPQPRYPALFPHEAEDARLTGVTRSLFRRRLALNFPSALKAIPVSSTVTAASGAKIA